MSDDCKSVQPLQWLIDHGAPNRLLIHGQIVGEVARELSRRLASIGVGHDSSLATTGAILHDVGKIVHPDELDGPGNQHELAGKQLLLQSGIAAEVAEMCVAHAAWSADSTIEQLIVAVSDHIWRGKRTADLESLLIAKVADVLRVEPWAAFLQVDLILSEIAAGADARLIAARGG